ncbi:hypothetical protein A2574_02820 [Candidatus Shapirobacteria bacterium RIFOXYD1_FULL_38_32]|uniref:50S ribosomal protein L15 n=3 Tax=Candidatus Shapironibacteriota TaxID=1752721 RepID=A0A0G0M8R3_9BACT|nr:MAG: hypothetical protein US90_C0009G0001 [Candidatus Shapirobacteria bacterium GW2011_GWE2_38_30]KKQ91428.1 MAG: hypothetical protein UT14_C0012G0002 [Candidatus Shapirobacteria bacterium GW2011_GWE1_38_92]OGL55878.1 MAG: hypothetical protein A2195_02990 [Candidatus Shapirobacteria bacterium RIFOXYA1_FULL_39_17]OGL57125.1 MAG: hypothetical protein A2574_02820 [Candidatus Shapirobacteria bacterium RIFOXYD1_FULL_38_32]OGL57462.1 MAG: hypothetical protein A2367_00205 [Candidatus Shapirobacteri
MEILNSLSKTTTKSARRRGRGYGSKSGGHTTGRGAKGDLVRGKSKLTFDGTKIKKGWIKRLPFLRGKHRTNSRASNLAFNLYQIEKWFKKDEIVSKESLTKKANLPKSEIPKTFKILSTGGITKALTFKGLTLSKTTQRLILKADGKIE